MIEQKIIYSDNEASVLQEIDKWLSIGDEWRLIGDIRSLNKRREFYALLECPDAEIPREREARKLEAKVATLRSIEAAKKRNEDGEEIEVAPAEVYHLPTAKELPEDENAHG